MKDMEAIISMSKIEFNSVQKDKLQKEFDGILAFVAKGGTKGEHRAIGTTVLGLGDLADDTPQQSFSIEEVLMNAPRKRGRYFTVPQIVD